jgi:hypothetical protein
MQALSACRMLAEDAGLLRFPKLLFQFLHQLLQALIGGSVAGVQGMRPYLLAATWVLGTAAVWLWRLYAA